MKLKYTQKHSILSLEKVALIVLTKTGNIRKSSQKASFFLQLMKGGPNKVRGLEKNQKINKGEEALIRHLRVEQL